MQNELQDKLNRMAEVKKSLNEINTKNERLQPSASDPVQTIPTQDSSAGVHPSTETFTSGTTDRSSPVLLNLTSVEVLSKINPFQKRTTPIRLWITGPNH